MLGLSSLGGRPAPRTANEILAEVFHARPADVEEMIRMRLEEKNWREEHEWPATFSLGE
jgi:hypothetical protein